ncbi:MAG TPA: hypothetical protein VFW40_11275 [Capsulimonadaceae bacterium]|nr:hypothetical protein [Capsulimonadaceae bacterium]
MKDRVGRIVVAMLAFALAVSGCSSRAQHAGVGPGRPLKSGGVSLVALARQNPDWLLVARTDQAIQRYQGMLATHAFVSAQSGETISNASSLLPAVSDKALPGLSETQNAQELHLDQLADREIVRLQASLETAENERLAAEKKLAQAQAQEEFITGRKQVADRFLDLERAIISGDSDRIVNLIVQIKALRVNATLPATAPDDYWEKLATQKESELAGLNAGTAKQLSLARAASDAEVASLQARLNKQTADHLAEMEASIDRQNTAAVQAQKSRLRKQRAQILTMTRSLQAEVASSVASLGSSKPSADTQMGASQLAAMSETNLFVAASLPAWRLRLVSAIGALEKQRARQAALVTEETRRAVLQVAQNNRLRITGWRGEGVDLTAVMLQSLRKERWGQS